VGDSNINGEIPLFSTIFYLES